ncbi:MAG: tetratricopeptide repeat protein [Planctomycetes bacterium]|nr:tetratricopeptide repeat protein [Planctomycetota bacterium]
MPLNFTRKRICFLGLVITGSLAVLISGVFVVKGLLTRVGDSPNSELVLLKRPNVPFEGEAGAGRLSGIFYVAKAELKDKLRVEENGESVVIAMADTIPLDHAVSYFTSRLENNPKELFSYLHRAEAHRLNKSSADAHRDLAMAISLDPNFKEALLARARLWDGERENAEALHALNEALRIDPEYGLAYFYRGKALAQIGEYDKAFEDFSQSIRLEVKVSQSHGNRGYVLMRKGEHKKALEDLGQSLQLHPRNVAALVNRGENWIALNEPEKALRDLDDALRIEPNSAPAHYQRSCALFKLNELEAAIRELDEVVRLDPSRADAIATRGLILNQMKMYDNARRDFEEAVRLSPKSSCINHLVFFLAACTQPKYRDGKRAVELAKEACELGKGESGICLSNLAAAYAEVGDFEQAVIFQERALEDKAYADFLGQFAQKVLENYRNKKKFNGD